MNHCLVCILSLGLTVHTTAEQPATAKHPSEPRLEKLLSYIPSDVQVVHACAGPQKDGKPSTTRSVSHVLKFLVDQGSRVGLLTRLSDSARIWTDVLVTLVEVFDYPYAVLLFDFDAIPRTDGGHQLSSLCGALLIQTGTDPSAIEQRIQKLLNAYTNSEETVLTARLERGVRSVTLTDRRLPDWATITWAAMDDMYVVALGNYAFEKVLQTQKEPTTRWDNGQWFMQARQSTHMDTAGWLFFARFNELQQGRDPKLMNKIGYVRAALGLMGVDRLICTAGRDGRSSEVHAVVDRNGRLEVLPIAGKQFLSDLPDHTIPREATSCAVVHWDAEKVVSRISSAYLAARGPTVQENMRAFWRDLEKVSKVSIENDILVHLGPYLIIHDYPPHALRLPVARTFLIPLTCHGDALRPAIERLMHTAQTRLAKTDWLRLHRPGDGVWYLQLGLLGPALTVTDHWLIISFSPEAVRQVADQLTAAVASEQTGPNSNPQSTSR